MKRIIAAVTGLSFLALTACHNNDTTLQAQQRMIDSMNTELAKKRVIDSMNEVVKTQYVLSPTPPPMTTTSTTTTTTAPVAAPSTASRSVHHSYAGRSSRAPRTRTRTVTRDRVVYQEAPRKRGWSAKAKGAVIGTAAGAAAGAIINRRNRGAGAVIGGVLGAGAGTGVGAIIDKKHGR